MVTLNEKIRHEALWEPLEPNTVRPYAEQKTIYPMLGISGFNIKPTPMLTVCDSSVLLLCGG